MIERVYWSERAVSSLKYVKEYISQVSPARAERVVSELVLYARQLKSFPYLGVMDERFGNDSLRKLIKGEHLLVYRVQGNVVEIVDVFSSKQNFVERFIKK